MKTGEVMLPVCKAKKRPKMLETQNIEELLNISKNGREAERKSMKQII